MQKKETTPSHERYDPNPLWMKFCSQFCSFVTIAWGSFNSVYSINKLEVFEVPLTGLCVCVFVPMWVFWVHIVT